MFISSRLTDSEYAAGQALRIVHNRARAHFDDSLHLAVSMRSFRAENVSAFVTALLDCQKEEARKTFTRLSESYPIAITRHLNAAKQWLRERARGTERFGVVASSKAMRLKPHGIDIRVSVDPIQLLSRRCSNGISGARTRTRLGLRGLVRRFSIQRLGMELSRLSRRSLVQHRKPLQSGLLAQRLPSPPHKGKARHGCFRSARGYKGSNALACVLRFYVQLSARSWNPGNRIVRTAINFV